MLKSAVKFMSVSLLLLSFTLANASETTSFSKLAKDWGKELSQAEKKIENDSDDKAKLAEYQRTLREIKTLASGEVSTAKEMLKTQKDLLATLGAAPENPSDEDKQVRLQREKLNQTIANIDSKLKQGSLVIAKTDEHLAAIDSAMKKRVREKIFAYEPIPLSEQEWINVGNNTSQCFELFDSWYSVIYLGLGLLIIALISKPLTKHLNQIIINAPGLEATKPLNCFRILMLGFAAYFVFLMRFNIVNITTAPGFENLLEIFASICLASVLFIALGRIRFITPKNTGDEIGEQKTNYTWLWNGIKKLTRLVLLVAPILSIIGYANLGLYLAFNILATIVAALVFYWLRSLVLAITHKLTASEEDDEKQEKKISPLAITIIEPIIAILALGFALFFWGMTSQDLTAWIEKYKDGIPIGDVTIDFVNLGSSIAIFFITILFTRLLQWFLSSRVFPHTNLNLGLRDAIVSITGYIGIITAILISLGAVGIDLSNLAIVAGALSVGIGFGLQSIFSNFVSGLILLFERPVKVGDWVIVGAHQGVIKKIRVRSTEIETFQNASIIVPNSQLISETVTNWTLYDKVGRVEIAVGVAYGSDTEKVKQVLLEVAANNSSVRKIPEAKVFFLNFGDSSLDFELRCFIRNIRDVFSVTSELRFEVDKAFRKHNIEIPFPQRDLHIKTLDEIKVSSEKPAPKAKAKAKKTKK